MPPTVYHYVAQAHLPDGVLTVDGDIHVREPQTDIYEQARKFIAKDNPKLGDKFVILSLTIIHQERDIL